MKPLGYQEQVWVVSADADGSEYAIASFEDEQAAFDAMSVGASRTRSRSSSAT